jgi:AcrR family transcriptional regulator
VHATRAAIRTAAADTFIARGYTATTMREIARRAGIAERTLYASFSNKASVFAHCLDSAVAGDDVEIPVHQQAHTLALAEESDPRALLGLTVEQTADLLDRAGSLIMVSVEAADADPDMRAAADEGEAATYAHFQRIARLLARTGGLRPGMSTRSATDILFTMSSPFPHHLLRTRRGWSSKRYRAWLLHSLESQLLADA